MADPRLFISYRRADAADIVRAIRERLARELGDDAVFLDVETLGAGEPFRRAVLDALRASDVVLVVVGPAWAGVEPDGRRRIDDPEDLVRIEVETALREGKHVVPVLVRGAAVPPPESLPAPLRRLFEQNAVRIEADAFDAGVERVLRTLGPRRARRRRIGLALAGAVILASVGSAIVLLDRPPSPWTLVVRVNGPSGPGESVGAGRVVLDAGGTRYTAELSTAGEAIFARLPAGVAGDSATVTPVVDGSTRRGAGHPFRPAMPWSCWSSAGPSKRRSGAPSRNARSSSSRSCAKEACRPGSGSTRWNPASAASQATRA